MVPKVPRLPTHRRAPSGSTRPFKGHTPFQNRGWCGGMSCSQNGQDLPPTHSLSYMYGKMFLLKQALQKTRKENNEKYIFAMLCLLRLPLRSPTLS